MLGGKLIHCHSVSKWYTNIISFTRKGKWAFNYTNKGKHMKNIIDICKGDTVIFIWGLKTLNGTHQRQISIDNDWYVSGIEIAKIKKGYYCDFNDETFESVEWKLNKEVEEKEYMHYFKFDKNYLYSSEDNKNLIFIEKFLYKDNRTGVNDRHPKLEGVINNLAWSLNNQGAPVELTVYEYNSLLAYLGYLQ
jgi:hypothetical protein